MKHRLNLTFVFATVLVVLSSNVCSAISDAQRQIFNYGINYFNETVCENITDSDTGLNISGNKTYKGTKIFSDSDLKKIQALKPFYVKAIQQENSNISWQLLAVVHYREASLSRSGPGNGQGPYQDFERNNVPASLKSGGGWKTGSYSDEEFLTATRWAVKALEAKAKANGLDNGPYTNNQVKTLLFAYNGKAGLYIQQALNYLGMDGAAAKRGEGSPYVMNLADERRDGSKHPSEWQQYGSDGGNIGPANQVPGGFLMYAALGGASSSGSSSSTSSSSSATSQGTGRIIWTGDSRTEGMQQYIENYPDTKNNNDTWISKSSMGYDWFNKTAVPKVTAQLKDGDTIVFNFGVNDLQNADKYVKKLISLAKGDWSKAGKIIVMSVNPVYGKNDGNNDTAATNATNQQIEAFNKTVKDAIAEANNSKLSYLDTYSSLKNSLKSSDFDKEGLHYTNKVYLQLYQKVRDQSPAVSASTVCTNTVTTALSGTINEKIVQQATAWANLTKQHNTCYTWGGGHGSQVSVDSNINAGFNSSGHGVDCSGFASAVIYKASGKFQTWDTDAMCKDTKNFKKVSDPQPGDLSITCGRHVAVILKVKKDGSYVTAESSHRGCGRVNNGPHIGSFKGTTVLRYIGGSK